MLKDLARKYRHCIQGTEIWSGKHYDLNESQKADFRFQLMTLHKKLRQKTKHILKRRAQDIINRNMGNIEKKIKANWTKFIKINERPLLSVARKDNGAKIVSANINSIAAERILQPDD